MPHKKLVHALASASISGPLLDWFIDYLFRRRQRVVLDDTSSSLIDINSGVPQGSILGPLLFSIFMNSIANLQDAQIILYADDILLYKPVVTQLRMYTISNAT